MNRTLFISDLHLSGQTPEATELFFDFLREEASRARSLYILGDLFDYWIGDDELSSPDGDPLGARVAAALARVADSGVEVSFMHGNRDFLIGERFCAASRTRLLDDPMLANIGGIATLLMHGDTLCTDDVDYQEWRLMARSDGWRREFLSKPLAERGRIILGLREQSMAATRSTPAEIMDVNGAAVNDAMRQHGVSRLIHGHTHRPGHHEFELSGTRCERWVLPDWYRRGGYLEVEAEGGAARLVRL